MQLVRDSSLAEIESYLRCMGGGNHADNMNRLKRFECYCFASLDEEEFFDLVFLQSDEVLKIAPRNEDRRLGRVAKRAINLEHPNLSGNWRLSDNLRQMREKLGNGSSTLEPIVLCESRNGEEMHGRWYLQDGSHRALAYATLMLLKEVQYERQTAYCSFSKGYFASK